MYPVSDIDTPSDAIHCTEMNLADHHVTDPSVCLSAESAARLIFSPGALTDVAHMRIRSKLIYNLDVR